MITRYRFLLIVLGFAPAVLLATEKNCGCACCKGREVCCCQPAEPSAAEPAKSHPLRGVIVAVNPERAELTVKHEAIPGVMRAMTMVFRVDAATTQVVRTGQAITARMMRVADEWWLKDVKAVTPSPERS
jgi:Cu/Ag efflux protein CusF